MTAHPLDLARDTGEWLTRRLGSPATAVVAGSGWAAAAEGLGTVADEVPLDEVPGAIAPTVEGHGGSVRAVDIDGRSVWVFGGRTHLYEGSGPHEVVHTVRAAVLAGARTIVLTNAAGSLDPALGPGTPVLVRDQLNLTGTSPMLGPEPPAGYPGRFCDLTALYSDRLRHAARAHDPTLTEGVYAGLLGGAFETPAEIRMLGALGATLVGMSTVLEAIAARHLGAEVAAISLVTNLAAGLASEISHSEVLDVARASTDRMLALIAALVRAG